MNGKKMDLRIRQGRLGNYLFSLFYVALGIFMYIWKEVDGYSLTDKYTLGPGFFPVLVAAALVLLGVLIAYHTHKGLYDESCQALPARENLLLMLEFLGIVVTAVLLVNFLGLIVTILLLFTVISRFICSYSWIYSIRSGVAAAVLIYIAFVVIFAVKFPVGILGI